MSSALAGSLLTLDCATTLTRLGRHDEALACCERGLEGDDLDERLYQALMLSALAIGRRAEGIAAYQRCKRVLVKVVGTSPSQETERLLRELVSR